MHELALTNELLAVICERAKEGSFNSITKVRLEIGELAGIDPESVKFCFPVVAKGTVAQEADLEILKIPGRAVCSKCQKEITVSSFPALCEDCGTVCSDFKSGFEIRIKDMEVP